MLRIYIRAGADSHDEQIAIADVLNEKFAAAPGIIQDYRQQIIPAGKALYST